ncbi:3-isopropylmalate dehydratase small subunit [Cupriavidus sp.]|uniref:3-isopropylmalate dehydratase small subunit n=1 Tax=Cupriavidus sp. TaxID=1873897 RepID=UPI0025C202B4|nr:3-isopropylmalate dehydratase small subunit [Cupriavidus sp.]MCA3187696.1 3-isopropylmalate dehydratase small subunit [Cupriavidus sp.]MCA3189113.1 3-isopropylmalate dehydratase small subunit [Cupriavidus sp.]MCA3198833.1 3-isopropylmalate dehydratase small subunit [Cupriavidus sp.]MCA3201577.1 3-isopropylmalate dehydratase small subunit [Cupriavidus sp.]MCA3230868.1 3-isopropylmalate dehydratase small subunit [Cupriavidus sp.]
MIPFTTLSGPAVPLMLDNVDTDTIIRIERLASFSRDQLGPYAMEALRLRPDGSEADSVLNLPAFRKAPILLAGRNFGCGSSREGAVWALAASGVRCVIAQSFGDIFHANCFQNGMLPIVLPPPVLAVLARDAGRGMAITVDLQTCQITLPGGHRLPFTVDTLKRTALLEGLDDLSLTLRKRDAIAQWQARDRLARPWIWDPVALD